jgi:hypothetical protein
MRGISHRSGCRALFREPSVGPLSNLGHDEGAIAHDRNLHAQVANQGEHGRLLVVFSPDRRCTRERRLQLSLDSKPSLWT